MDKGTQIYQELVDTLVEKSRNCVSANWARKGEAKGNSEEIANLNSLFAKLTDEEREIIAKFAVDTYMSGIYDVLCELEWYIDCRDMIITVDGEKLPTTEFEGLGNDFIGRREGWKWN